MTQLVLTSVALKARDGVPGTADLAQQIWPAAGRCPVARCPAIGPKFIINA